MNGVDSLVGALGRGIDKITNIVGKWGSSQPVYDSPSSEFESVLSSKEWVSDVNDDRL